MCIPKHVPQRKKPTKIKVIMSNIIKDIKGKTKISTEFRNLRLAL